MFDIGFFELLFVMLVSLVVLGPSRLPEAVKAFTKAWFWVKSQLTKTKQEVNRTFGLNETYQDSRNDEILKDLKASNK